VTASALRIGVQGDARLPRPLVVGRQQFGEQALQVAGRRLRLQAVGLELGEQEQAVEDVGHRADPVLQAVDVGGCAGCASRRRRA
jgi:hypothetical protein